VMGDSGVAGGMYEIHGLLIFNERKAYSLI